MLDGNHSTFQIRQWQSVDCHADLHTHFVTVFTLAHPCNPGQKVIFYLLYKENSSNDWNDIINTKLMGYLNFKLKTL